MPDRDRDRATSLAATPATSLAATPHADTPDWDDDGDDTPAPTCRQCGAADSTYLGRLGRLDWFNCRACGWEHCHRV